MSSEASRRPILFPAWEYFIPKVGIFCSQCGNKLFDRFRVLFCALVNALEYAAERTGVRQLRTNSLVIVCNIVSFFISWVNNILIFYYLLLLGHSGELIDSLDSIDRLSRLD